MQQVSCEWTLDQPPNRVGYDRVFVNSWHVIDVYELSKDQKKKLCCATVYG